jgi:hypothetical protein
MGSIYLAPQVAFSITASLPSRWAYHSPKLSSSIIDRIERSEAYCETIEGHNSLSAGTAYL